jgi:thiamine-phosphate pyrophosphorylase
LFDLYLITPDLAPRAVIAERCARALAAAAPGRVAVQLRSKHLDAGERRALALELRDLTRARGAALLVNADLELAREAGADGVQLPERAASVADARARLGAAMLLGASRHDLAGVRAAAGAGATFATLSPIFGVPDKGAPLGLPGLAHAAAHSPLPLIALGGIDAERARDAVQAGAHGVAVMRAVWDGARPDAAVVRLLAAIDAGRVEGRPRTP